MLPVPLTTRLCKGLSTDYEMNRLNPRKGPLHIRVLDLGVRQKNANLQQQVDLD